MDEHDDTAAPTPERAAPFIGGLVILVAVSSLLDDTGLIEHPWWVPITIGLVVVAVALMAKTIRRLVRSS